MRRPASSSTDASVAGEDEERRSEHMRRLIRQQGDAAAPASPGAVAPRMIVQFWDDLDHVPEDVAQCLATWGALDGLGFFRVLYDDVSARRYIAERFSARHVQAFDLCRHPAMRSDYFRLCYLVSAGGVYIDADDAYTGADPGALSVDGRLQLQPLCYDTATGEMVGADDFLGEVRPSPAWIYYVNNNPIIAPAGHPVLRAALGRATRLLLNHEARRRGVQSTTGPGNLTAALVSHAAVQDAKGADRDFVFLRRWEGFAVSRWPLGYRSDNRNWRLWDPSG